MAGSRLKTSLISDPAAIAGIEDEWRVLAERCGNAFVSPQWFRSWWQNRPTATSALVVAARRQDGSLAGVLPLVLDFARRPRMIRFAGASFGDRFGPAAAEADEAVVAAAAMTALSDVGLDRYTLVLNHVDPARPWWKQIQRGSTGSRAGIVQQLSEQPYIDLRSCDWEGYLASRSASFRKKLRQRERKLTDGREVRDRTATAQTLEADLSTFFSLHHRRWQGGSSLDAYGGRPLLETFARVAQGSGWLRLRILEVDGKPVAALLGWRVGTASPSTRAASTPAGPTSVSGSRC